MMDHSTAIMRHEDRHVRDKELILAMLEQCPVCTLAMYDETYPYQVPLNFGYAWEDKLTIYVHMASKGYKLDLLKKNPHVCLNAFGFVDRSHWGKYRNERQDYRSVTVFGKVEFITKDQSEEFVKALNLLQDHYKREHISKAPDTDRLLVAKITADAVTAKSNYPIHGMDEVYMPTNEELDRQKQEQNT